MAIISIPSSFAGVSIPSNVFNPNSPLSLLYGGLGVKTYKYPSDLATSPSKSHYVQFSISEIIPAGYNKSGGSGPVSNLIQGDTVGLAGIGSWFSEDSAASSGDGLFAANDDEGNAMPAVESGGSYKAAIGEILSKGLKISPTRTQPKASISLYMPDTLSAQYSSSYDELRLTDLGAGINTLRNIDQIAGPGKMKSIMDGFKSGGISGGLKQAGNIASTDPAAISLLTRGVGGAGNALGNKIGIGGVNVENLESVVLKGQGYAINPQLQMIYRGIGLRSFTLAFVFTPNSQDESNEVNYIINQFKYHFAPTLMAGKEVSSDSMYLIPPSIFTISFMIDGTENKFLPKYGNCVLKDLDINYTPNGWASYDDGAPVQTTLTLTFTETEILDKMKIQKGYNGVDGGLR